MEIKIENLQRSFGDKIILKNLNLSMGNGEVWCLLGTNGAGKTTLINIILTLLKPDSGTVAYDGEVYEHLSKNLKHRIGVLSENNPVIEELTAQSYLKLSGKLYQIEESLLEKRIQDLTEYFFNETDVLKRRMAGFSTGMKKKMGLIAAVLHTPDLLILDEPFSGLDPLAAQESIDFINTYSNPYRTIFLSSHDLSYVEKVATHVAVLNNGEIVFSGTLQDFTAGDSSRIGSALLEMLQPEGHKKKNLEWL